MGSTTTRINDHQTWLYAFVAFMVTIFCNCGGARAANPSAPLDNFIRRLASLQNIQVQFRLDAQLSPPPEWLGHFIVMGHDIDSEKTHNTYLSTFSFLKGNALFDLKPDDITLASATQRKEDVVGYRCIMTAERVEKLDCHSIGPRFLGSIAGTQDAPEDALIDVGLGLRIWRGQSWLTQRDLQSATTTTDQSNSTIELNGPNNCIHRWYFDHDLNTPVKYTVTGPHGWPFIIFEFHEFVKVGDIMLPMKITETRQVIRSDSAGGEKMGLWTLESNDITVLGYKMNAADNTEDKYLMVWPKGSRVLDMRTNEEFDVRSRNRTLTDKEIYEIEKMKLEKAASRPATSQP